MSSKDLCQSKIVFIDIDNPLYLEPMIPYIQKLSKIVPSAALDFELIPVVTAPYVDLAVDELEQLVKEYYQKGYRYIGLPSQSTLLRPFLLGTGGSLDNIPIDRRWPNVNFMVQAPSIAAVDLMGNVYRFLDVDTLLDANLLEYNLDQFIKGPGRAYIIYQGAGDAYSSELTNSVLFTLLEMGVTTDAFEVGQPDNTFDSDALEDAVNFIYETIPPAPARSVIVVIVNGLVAEEFTQAALKAGLFTDFAGSAIHYNYGLDYRPEYTPAPVTLHFGRMPVEGVPSKEAAQIGVPLDPAKYYSLQYWLTYLDSYLWAATCGNTYGINDKQLKFDAQGTRISYYLADFFIPANSTETQMGPLYFNPRWFDPEADAVPDFTT